jgi:hypothetical protein
MSAQVDAAKLPQKDLDIEIDATNIASRQACAIISSSDRRRAARMWITGIDRVWRCLPANVCEPFSAFHSTRSLNLRLFKAHLMARNF